MRHIQSLVRLGSYLSSSFRDCLLALLKLDLCVGAFYSVPNSRQTFAYSGALADDVILVEALLVHILFLQKLMMKTLGGLVDVSTNLQISAGLSFVPRRHDVP